jgi:hypothetical protein
MFRNVFFKFQQMHAGEVLRCAPEPSLTCTGNERPSRQRRTSVSSLAGTELPDRSSSPLRSSSPMARRAADSDAPAADGDGPIANRSGSPIAAARLRRASDAALFSVRLSAAGAAAREKQPDDFAAARRVFPPPPGDERRGAFEAELGACALCGAPTGGREILCAAHVAKARRPPPATSRSLSAHPRTPLLWDPARPAASPP